VLDEARHRRPRIRPRLPSPKRLARILGDDREKLLAAQHPL
jgi:hypothetical protein